MSDRGYVGPLEIYLFLVIGGPTHAFGPSAAMKTFTKRLQDADVRDKKAFDTKLKSRFAGSAAKGIEQRMKQHGMKVLKPHASATVLGSSSNRLGLS